MLLYKPIISSLGDKSLRVSTCSTITKSSNRTGRMTFLLPVTRSGSWAESVSSRSLPKTDVNSCSNLCSSLIYFTICKTVLIISLAVSKSIDFDCKLLLAGSIACNKPCTNLKWKQIAWCSLLQVAQLQASWFQHLVQKKPSVWVAQQSVHGYSWLWWLSAGDQSTADLRVAWVLIRHTEQQSFVGVWNYREKSRCQRNFGLYHPHIWCALAPDEVGDYSNEYMESLYSMRPESFSAHLHVVLTSLMPHHNSTIFLWSATEIWKISRFAFSSLNFLKCRLKMLRIDQRVKCRSIRIL